MSTYRPNAAIIVTDGNGRVLLCERADLPGAVQTVQGGIDEGETPERAARRELAEEVGLMEPDYEIVSSIAEPLRYVWPPELRDRLREQRDAFAEFEGQEQYFFLARVSPDVTFDLDAHVREFSRVWWGLPEEMIEGAWEYKKPNLKSALRQFGLLN
jgi:8-oxo-dGTP pyrophosphatase MutT (NUDIX family)